MRHLIIFSLLAISIPSFGNQIQTCQKLKQKISSIGTILAGGLSFDNVLITDTIEYETRLQIFLLAYRDVCGPISVEMAEDLLSQLPQ